MAMAAAAGAPPDKTVIEYDAAPPLPANVQRPPPSTMIEDADELLRKAMDSESESD